MTSDATVHSLPELRELPVPEAQRLAELGLLTAKLVHELRQPLFAARALAQLAQAAARPEQVASHLDGVLGQLQTLHELLVGYSDLTRSPTTESGPFDVWRPVNAAVAILEHRARSAQVVIVCGGVGATLAHGHVLAVQQVIVNLGVNAIDALAGRPDATLTIDVLAEPVRVRVTDNGPGLDPRIRDRLFEPFRTTKPAGTGLGLTLSRDLVRSFGGELRLLESHIGVSWEVTLP